MTFLKVLLFVLVSCLGYSHCAFVDTLKKCSLADKSCHKDLIQFCLKSIGENGVPELDMPPIDPIQMKHIDGSIPNVIDLQLVDGVAEGIKDCVIESTNVDIEHLRASIKLTCNVTIRGKYIVKSSSPLITDLIGGALHGEGNGKVEVERITITIGFPFIVIKRGEETFFKSELKKYEYTYKIKGKVVFFADKLYVGEKESSKEILKVMNVNWKDIISTFGGHFFNIAIKIVYKFLQKFFTNVATHYYLIDDVSSYV